MPYFNTDTPPPSLIQPSSSTQGNPLGQLPSSSSPLQNEALPLIKPKDEPLDHSEEETASQSGLVRTYGNRSRTSTGSSTELRGDGIVRGFYLFLFFFYLNLF